MSSRRSFSCLAIMLLITTCFVAMPAPFVIAGDGSLQLSLPWTPDEPGWGLTGGPHSYHDQDEPGNSLDFGNRGQGIVRSAREGITTIECGGARVRVEPAYGWSTTDLLT